MEDGFEVVLDGEASNGSLGGMSGADEDATSGSTGQGPAAAGEGDVADSRPAVVGLGAAVVAAEAAAAADAAAGSGRRVQRRKATFHLGLAEELLAMIKVRELSGADQCWSRRRSYIAVNARSCLAAICHPVPEAQGLIMRLFCCPLPQQASPPEEFDTAHTSKLWAAEQLLRYCAAHDEKLVLVGERYTVSSRVALAMWPWVCTRVWSWSGACCHVVFYVSYFSRIKPVWVVCLSGMPCSLDYLIEIEQLLERLQLRMAGA